ncbi:MAG: hypothetical protein ABI818_16415 [Acidobacteriota bacterium]
MTDGPDATDGEPAAAAHRGISPPAVLACLVLGAILGGMVVEYWLTRTVSTSSAQTAAPPAAGVVEDVTHLKAIVPTQSHTMTDVGYHWANLWFAAGKKNWPLAKYFFDEARQSMRWTILIRPVRQRSDGGTVDVKGIFTAIDMSALAAVQLALEDENSEEFEKAYTQALDACHSCHVASEKPFLRPAVPTVPPTTLIDFDPAPAK